MTIAIIGGSGLSQLPELAIKEEIIIDTPWGKPSAPIIIGRLIRKKQPNKTDIVFLPRHGNSHTIPPHKINYRANILALKKVGVKKIISINAVGGITKLMNPDCIIVPALQVATRDGTRPYENMMVMSMYAASIFPAAVAGVSMPKQRFMHN